MKLCAPWTRCVLCNSSYSTEMDSLLQQTEPEKITASPLQQQDRVCSPHDCGVPVFYTDIYNIHLHGAPHLQNQALIVFDNQICFSTQVLYSWQFRMNITNRFNFFFIVLLDFPLNPMQNTAGINDPGSIPRAKMFILIKNTGNGIMLMEFSSSCILKISCAPSYE